MDLLKETQRSLYATVGAAAWMVDAMLAIPDQVENAWQERDRWMNRAGDAFDSLAGRGQAVLGTAQEEVQHRARQVGNTARWIPGVVRAEGAVEEEELAIADYDGLTADQIAHKLPALSQKELRQLERYEMKNRHRSTVLNRIEELLGDEPWTGYDDMTVEEILPRMRSLDPDEREELAAYESRHKQRRSILAAAARS